MIICGIDYSINSPGVVKATLDDNLDITEIEYRGFTSVKKVAKSDDNILYYKKVNRNVLHTPPSQTMLPNEHFYNNYEKSIWIAHKIQCFICGKGVDHGDGFVELVAPDYVAMEGYALNAKGRVFDIAEATMVTKLSIYNAFIPMRVYDPNTIKKYATDNGNASKVLMEEAFDAITDDKLDLSHLPSGKVPKEDLIDAYFTMKLLQLELKLRHGLLQVQDLSKEKIEIFNRVTKAYPENILVRPFLQKRL